METNKAQKEIASAERSKKIAETKLAKAQKELAEANAAQKELLQGKETILVQNLKQL